MTQEPFRKIGEFYVSGPPEGILMVALRHTRAESTRKRERLHLNLIRFQHLNLIRFQCKRNHTFHQARLLRKKKLKRNSKYIGLLSNARLETRPGTHLIDTK